MEKRCILDEERTCVECGECLRCDLDPNKYCDNCMRCVKKSNADYLAIEIDEVINGTFPNGETDIPVQPVESVRKQSPSVRAVRPRRPRTSAEPSGNDD